MLVDKLKLVEFYVEHLLGAFPAMLDYVVIAMCFVMDLATTGTGRYAAWKAVWKVRPDGS